MEVQDGGLYFKAGGVFMLSVNMDIASSANITNFSLFYNLSSTVSAPSASDPHFKIGSASPVSNVLPNNLAGSHILQPSVGDILQFYVQKNTNNADDFLVIDGTVTVSRLGLFLET